MDLTKTAAPAAPAEKPQEAVSAVQMRMRKMRDARKRVNYLSQALLNMHMYQGNQYYYMSKTGRIINRPTREDAKEKHRKRLVVNKIQPAILLWLSKMTRNDPSFQAVPGQDISAVSLRSAQLSEAILEDLWSKLRLADVRNEAYLGALIRGLSYVEVYWDANVGKAYTCWFDPETDRPVIGAELEAAKAQGLPLVQKTLHEGQIGVEVIAPSELIIVGDTDPQRARATYKVRGYSPETLEERYGEKAKGLRPNASHRGNEQPETDGRDTDNLVEVYSYMERPTAANNKGRHVVWTNAKRKDSTDPADHTVLHDGRFPYTSGKLPFIRFATGEVPGEEYPSSIIEQLIPLSYEINRRVSEISEYFDMVAMPQYWYHAGSIKKGMALNDIPGAMFEFTGDKPPQPMEKPPLNAKSFDHLTNILKQFDEIAGGSELQRGEAPAGVESGIAFVHLDERTNDRMRVWTEGLERSISQLGSCLLEMAQQFYVTERVVRVTGAAGQQEARRFTGADLSSGAGVMVVPGSTLPRSLAGKQALVMEAVKRGELTMMQAAGILKLDGFTTLLAPVEGNKRKQERELERIIAGEQVPVGERDNHAIHLEIIDLLLQSIEYEFYAPEVQQAILAHAQEHQAALDAKAQRELPDNVRVNYQIKADGTPEEREAVLRTAGVEEAPDAQTITASDQMERQDAAAMEQQLAEHSQAVKVRGDLMSRPEEPLAQPGSSQASL